MQGLPDSSGASWCLTSSHLQREVLEANSGVSDCGCSPLLWSCTWVLPGWVKAQGFLALLHKQPRNNQELLHNRAGVKGEGWSILQPAARAEEDSVILVNLSSCCKNFLNASYHLLLMLSRVGWKPGGFPALSCPTYNGVILDLFPVISASSSVSSAYSWVFFFLIFFFLFTSVALCPESSLLGRQEFL